MSNQTNNISERLIEFGVSIVKLCLDIEKTKTGSIIANQLLRSGTSVGANYEEARGAQSKQDFIHKLHISLKEIRETIYWLEIINRSEINNKINGSNLLEEAKEISKIIGKSLLTAKANK